MWIAALIVVCAVAAFLVAGAVHWSAVSRELRARLESARAPVRPRTVDFQELDRLPPPVERYFRKVLRDGQPMVAAAFLKHRGKIDMGKAAPRWKRLQSRQEVVTNRPGFDWVARVSMIPGLFVRVHDAYVAGEGILNASLFGLFSVANLRGTGQIAEGELMRYLAEAAWYPTALLPSQGVVWEPVDNHSARARLTIGTIGLSLLFTFDSEGLIDRVRAESRGRVAGNRVIPTPWEGHLWNYADRGNILVPLEGEVAWVLADGPRPYWRGTLTDLRYEWAR